MKKYCFPIVLLPSLLTTTSVSAVTQDLSLRQPSAPHDTVSCFKPVEDKLTAEQLAEFNTLGGTIWKDLPQDKWPELFKGIVCLVESYPSTEDFMIIARVLPELFLDFSAEERSNLLVSFSGMAADQVKTFTPLSKEITSHLPSWSKKDVFLDLGITPPEERLNVITFAQSKLDDIRRMDGKTINAFLRVMTDLNPTEKEEFYSFKDAVWGDLAGMYWDQIFLSLNVVADPKTRLEIARRVHKIISHMEEKPRLYMGPSERCDCIKAVGEDIKAEHSLSLLRADPAPDAFTDILIQAEAMLKQHILKSILQTFSSDPLAMSSFKQLAENLTSDQLQKVKSIGRILWSDLPKDKWSEIFTVMKHLKDSATSSEHFIDVIRVLPGLVCELSADERINLLENCCGMTPEQVYDFIFLFKKITLKLQPWSRRDAFKDLEIKSPEEKVNILKFFDRKLDDLSFVDVNTMHAFMKMMVSLTDAQKEALFDLRGGIWGDLSERDRGYIFNAFKLIKDPDKRMKVAYAVHNKMSHMSPEERCEHIYTQSKIK